MAKSKQTHREQVESYLSSLNTVEQELLLYLQEILLNTSELLAAHIKWNSLSFYYTGALKDFDPKTYEKDLLVCNLHRGKLLLIFPTGATFADELKGKNYADGRKIITIEDFADAQRKTPGLIRLIEDWISGKAEK